MSSFQLKGVDYAPLAHLFNLTEGELRELGAVRRIATEMPGFPCRVSMEDALLGDELLLLSYMHQPAASPYRASGPIFVRRNAQPCSLDVGEIPPYVSRRLISVRAYDATHMLIAAAVCEGAAVANELQRTFDRTDVAYIHLHNAKQGCFSCLVDRVD